MEHNYIFFLPDFCQRSKINLVTLAKWSIHRALNWRSGNYWCISSLPFEHTVFGSVIGMVALSCNRNKVLDLNPPSQKKTNQDVAYLCTRQYDPHINFHIGVTGSSDFSLLSWRVGQLQVERKHNAKRVGAILIVSDFIKSKKMY